MSLKNFLKRRGATLCLTLLLDYIRQLLKYHKKLLQPSLVIPSTNSSWSYFIQKNLRLNEGQVYKREKETVMCYHALPEDLQKTIWDEKKVWFCAL